MLNDTFSLISKHRGVLQLNLKDFSKKLGIFLSNQKSVVFEVFIQSKHENQSKWK